MTRLIAALYMALAVGATPALADVDAAKAAREGDMKKLVFHSAPQEVSDAVFFDESDAELTDGSKKDQVSGMETGRARVRSLRFSS